VPERRYPISRRSALAGIGAAALLAPGSLRAAGRGEPELERIEAELGGRLGVAAVDLKTGATLTHRANERFAMCSTFKWALAALVLADVDAGRAALGEPIRFTKADLLPHSPITKTKVTHGSMTLADLCAAAIEVSDNAAANLLLRRVGGPARLTAFLRRTGDPVTRLDRTETALNENLPGDPRDSTTPAAMVGSMRRILFGSVLASHSRGLLQGWMRSSTSGLDRLRAGLPVDWIAGDKAGTSGNGANNDVAFALPRPHARPILIASYIDAPMATAKAAAAAHAAIARQALVALS
jgi:beta-lactamase class A